jgi:hypothetical protein
MLEKSRKNEIKHGLQRRLSPKTKKCLYPAAFFLILLTALSGCSDDSTPVAIDGDLPDAHPDDAHLDDGGAPKDGDGSDSTIGDDATVTDGAPQDGAPQNWQNKNDDYVFGSDSLIAVHPNNPDRIAVLEDIYDNGIFEVWVTENGQDFFPVTVMTFDATPNFTAYPVALAYDPANGANLVAAVATESPPEPGQEVVHAWSSDGGQTYDHTTGPFTDPWPAEDMRFVGGTPTEVVWRAGNTFYFSSTLGASFDRTESIDPLPAECDTILGFDTPTDDHEVAAVWCGNGQAHVCDLVSDDCAAIPTVDPPTIINLIYAPSDPSTLYLFSGCSCGYSIFRSTDGGQSTIEVFNHRAYHAYVAPNDALCLCALDHLTSELRCTTDGGQSWSDLTIGEIPPYGSIWIESLAFDHLGGLWAAASPGVFYHPPL